MFSHVRSSSSYSTRLPSYYSRWAGREELEEEDDEEEERRRRVRRGEAVEEGVRLLGNKGQVCKCEY